MLPDWRSYKIHFSKNSDKSDKTRLSVTPNPDWDRFCHFCHQNSENQNSKPLLPESPADSPPGLGEGFGPDESTVSMDTVRRIIAGEMSAWIPEQRAAWEYEIRQIVKYRRRRGPVTSNPAEGSIPRSESLQTVSVILARLGAIWLDGLESNPQWQAKTWEAERTGNREAFHSILRDWEASETRRVEIHMNTVRETAAG